MTRHPGGRINVDLDHNCFGCGGDNAHGLHLTFFPDDRGGVWSPFVAEGRFEGYTGMVHGGVISTVLDEVMAWSLYRNEIWAVTGSLAVRFRAPVLVGERTRAVGWIVGQRGRRVETGGEIRREEDGSVAATATASFVRVPAAQAEAWKDRYLSDDGRFDDREVRA
jgi:acyl-coenzyme A thioesterase PaaI-like protein